MTVLLNPFRFGGGAGSSLTAFTGLKAVATGAAGDTISGWDASHYNPGGHFNETTGEWTAPAAGLMWMGAGGFNNAAVGGGVEYNIQAKVNGSGVGGLVTREIAGTGDSHGDSVFAAAILQAAQNDVYTLAQQGDIAEDAWFSAAPLSSSVAFSAQKATASGSANATITGYTEEFDLGGDFDPSTGVFTVPTTGKYLIAFQGFPGSTTVTTGHRVKVNGTSNYLLDYGIAGGNGWGNSLGHSFLLDLSSGQTVEVEQVGATLATCRFSMALVSPTVAFAARRSGTAGASGDTIGGYTEDFDLGADFNATSGVFTAPASGLHLAMGHGKMDRSSGSEGSIDLMLDGAQLITARHYVAGVTVHGCRYRLGAVVNMSAGGTLALRQDGAAASSVHFAVMGL